MAERGLPLGGLFVSMPVCLCVCWCCCGVTGLSRRFCAALSYVELHLHLHLCLARLSRGSAPPAPICPIVLIVDHNAVTPVTFANNREINRAPPITHSASHPANEGAAKGAFSRIPTPGGHPGAAHPTVSMTAGSNNTQFHTETCNKKNSFRARLGADTDFFHSCGDGSNCCYGQR